MRPGKRKESADGSGINARIAQIAWLQCQHGGDVGACGMTTQHGVLGIGAEFHCLLLRAGHRFGCIAQKFGKAHLGIQTVIGNRHHRAARRQRRADKGIVGLAPGLP